MIEVTDIRIRSFDLSFLDIYWDVKPSFDDIADYQFIVEKADNEFGPYVALTVPVVNRFHVRDTTVKGQHSYYHKLWYRIRVQYREVAKQTADGVSTDTVYPTLGGAKLAARPDLIALEMARINNLKLREFSGRQIWVFPRKKSGTKCSVCFDHVMQRRTRGNCQACFGTGYIGGYHAPVQVYGMVVTPDEQTTHAGFTSFESQDTMLLMGNYPEVFEGDLILEAENVRWRVGSRLSKVKKSRALIRQQVAIHQVPKGDVEYSIPLNLTDAEIQALIASPERNYTNPQTLDSDSLSSTILGVFGTKS